MSTNSFYGDFNVDGASANVDFSNITRIEYRGQLVLMTEQLANFYGTKAVNLKQNFNNNKDRFIEGDHYFKLEGDELNLFKNSVKNFYPIDIKAKNSLYLWTKRGCARHCKSIGTDTAWDVFELLESAYFDKKKEIPDTPITNISDFQRGKELVKLAQAAQEPTTKKRLIAKAANLILGEEFLKVDDLDFNKQILLQF